MADPVKVNLGNVQKTLFLPLWGRAVESKKKSPMLIDRTAVEILEQVDFDFSEITKNIDELSQIAWIKRSLFCDQVVSRFLERNPRGTIVNIGCGLDTTFERTNNGRLTWYDLDLPDVIELRKKFLKENEQRKFIASSFLEKEWLNSVKGNENILFLAAGVFYYFREEQIRAFTVRLIEEFPGSEMFFDVCSPIGVRIANKKVIESSGLDNKSHLVWGLKSKRDVLDWNTGIKILATFHYFRTLRFGIRNFLLGMLSDTLGIQYMIHLRLGASV